MMGGYGYLHDQDINFSDAFLTSILKQRGTKNEDAIDCGAGIGRVTRSLLSRHFKCVIDI
jgi:protein N-terminal methyltransferase